MKAAGQRNEKSAGDFKNVIPISILLHLSPAHEIIRQEIFPSDAFPSFSLESAADFFQTPNLIPWIEVVSKTGSPMYQELLSADGGSYILRIDKNGNDVVMAIMNVHPTMKKIRA